MRELGGETTRAHHELGRIAAGAALDALYLLGPLAAEVRAGAVSAGMPAERIVVAASHAELAARVRADLRSGDLLLVKGSRGATMEELLRQLGAEQSP
jgi:UDP-N-acetylmuramoyl-tripeptide--D-alanyl-D-alanine ligase